MSTNTRVYQRKVKRGGDVSARPMKPFEKDDEDVSQLVVDKAKRIQEFMTVAEQVAKSTIYVRNWYYPRAAEFYPYLDRMKRVDKYFPYAVGGPLLVDEPQNEAEADMCRTKAKTLKDLKYRYVIIEHDTKLFDALQQLGEL